MDVDIAKLNRTILCYAETVYRFNGLWEGPDPLTPLISLFFFQLALSMAVVHILVYLLKPLKQPPLIAEILAGLLLGPSALGRISSYRKFMFPSFSFKIMEPMAHLSIAYYAFLVGLKMDVKSLLRTDTKAIKVATGGIVIPFTFGSGLYFIFKCNTVEQKAGFLFWGTALTVTGFSVLNRVLDRHQLLHTEIGKTALSSALVTDMSSWCLLALSFAVSNSPANMHWALISTIAFVLVCVYYIRPALRWAIRKTPEGQGYSEFYICSILTGVVLCGVMTDACGTHPIIGAFVFGLVIPNEVLEATILDKMEDFVLGILMPVFYVVCGLRTNLWAMAAESSWIVVMLVIAIACSVKVISAFAVTAFTDLTTNEALGVGLLSNVKSVMVLIVLEAGQTQQVLSTQTYSMMVAAVLIMTLTATPAALLYRPVQNMIPYKRRMIQGAKPEEELRVLACIYNTRNVPTIINLLRTSKSSNSSPITVFALQLVELVGRACTMLVVHESRKTGTRNPTHSEAQADQIIAAFDNYELSSEGVRTQALTARCAFSTMDDDICSVAKEKRASFLIVPFHRLQTLDGEMEDINASIRGVNEGVLDNAPCSVGILIDRGFGEMHEQAHNIVVLFFGGPDDREALAYAWRMSENKNLRLSVVKFTPSDEAIEMAPVDPNDRIQVNLQFDYEREKVLDDDFLSKFKIATMNNESISFVELVLNDEEEAIKAIKSMDDHNHDLYLVGRGRGMMSPLTSGLADWCDCPELGPIGDLLVTSEFESAFSVLIVQQYLSKSSRDGSMRSASSINYGEEVAMRPSMSESEGFESLGSFRKWDHEI